MSILYLPLKAKWYEMIERGEKTEEYREVKPYWLKRVPKWGAHEYRYIRFSYGYSKRTMTFHVPHYTIDFGKPEWGAPKGKAVFIFYLGEKIN